MENLDFKPLSQKEISRQLELLPKGWTYSKKKIHKTFTFKSFSDGIKLLSKLAPFCDSKEHHPDITVEYKKITFDLNRYDIGGKVINMDFIVAKKIETIYKKFSV